MRKLCSVCCVTVSVVLGVYLDYLAYRITRYDINSKLAMLMFIPTFIIIYWLGSLYDVLSVKDGSAIFSKKCRIAFRVVYSVNVLAVCAVWLWVIYKYTYFFGNIIGTIKDYLA